MSALKKEITMLAEPFAPADIQWRLQSAGEKDSRVWCRVLAYIDNRAIMDRLDDVCGPENWRNEYRREGDAFMCGLSIKVGDEWVTKWDGAEESDIEGFKGGLSGAMKRAGSQWGIGRYLYNLEEGFGAVSPSGENYAPAKPGKYPAFRWDPPKLPAWALPGGSGRPDVVSQPQKARGDAARPTLTLTRGDAHEASAVAASKLTAEDLKLLRVPGTKAHFHGDGGKLIIDVPVDRLAAIVGHLRNIKNAEQYAPEIAAIDHRIAEERGGA